MRAVGDKRTLRFMQFLKEESARFEAIYILGDLFDAWPGTNALLIEKYSPILEMLADLVRDGKRVYYIEGNHDFHLGKYFSEKMGVQVYPNHLEEDWEGRKVYLAHGDLGNPNDKGYRILRYVLRHPILHFLLRTIPPSWIDQIATRFSAFSRDYKKSNHEKKTVENEVKMVYRKTATEFFKKGYDVVMFGHTHYPDQLELEHEGRTCQYFNTGDWLHNFTYLEFEGSKFYTKVHSI